MTRSIIRTIIPMARRDLLQLVAGGGIAAALPIAARAEARRDVLVIGIDISDVITLDPAREGQYTAPIPLAAAYDTLVTTDPGDYVNLKPALAAQWARTADGRGWRLTLRTDVTFPSGHKFTADDVKFSIDRVIRVGDQPSQYITNIDQVNVIAPDTVDILLHQPAEPILTILAAPPFGIYDSKLLAEHGGDASADAATKDSATTWLNQHSAGSGAYTIAAWQRNAQIQLTRNPHYWRTTPGFERIVIRHIPDAAAQLLALQRGDIDAAFNLIPEQIAPLSSDKSIRVEKLTSLDFVYMALTQDPAINPALANKLARQAIGWAIDYDGIRHNLLGDAALLPANFLPIGVRGSTEAIAKQIGYHQDLDRARDLLKQAGMADGFSFDINYGNAAIAGVSYGLLAQKIQSDLARIGIKANLAPLDQVTMRTQYTTGKTSAALTFWNPPAVEDELWAAASVERVAKRVHWSPPADLVKLVHQAAAESDPEKQSDLWVAYQKAIVDQANLITLFQPIYQIAVRDSIKVFPLTAAGWQVDLYAVKA